MTVIAIKKDDRGRKVIIEPQGRHGSLDPTNYDGFRLDAIQLNCALINREDFDKLIQFLEVTKHCFDRPGKLEL